MPGVLRRMTTAAALSLPSSVRQCLRLGVVFAVLLSLFHAVAVGYWFVKIAQQPPPPPGEHCQSPAERGLEPDARAAPSAASTAAVATRKSSNPSASQSPPQRAKAIAAAAAASAARKPTSGGAARAAAVPREGMYVCSGHMGLGQLGNSMFDYIGAYVAAKRHGLNFLVRLDLGFQLKGYRQMSSLFKLTAPLRNGSFPTDRTFRPAGWGIYATEVERFESFGRFTTIHGWLQSWRYLAGYEGFVREEFALTDKYRGVVDAFFGALGKQSPNGKANDDMFIAVHVRRGDMAKISKVYKTATPSYVIGAMTYFQNKYGRERQLTFVVATDDRKWTQATLDAHWRGGGGDGSRVVYTNGTAEEDMAILSSCHHAVITCGTFGWWAGWLTGGEVLYYRDFIWNGSYQWAQFNAYDYYPPSWIGRT